mmetsp:Transcript_15530/g.22709  ORF Transcript_15530/g.22709 Transcript_15530/m.22709 type:complete len:358 (-) Transcript_15530:622-1695(-)
MTEMLKRPVRRRIGFVATFALALVTGYSLLWESSPDYDTIRRRTSRATLYDKLLARNTGDVMEPLKESDTPVYWHIPKSSGTSMKRYYGCMGLTAASETGIIDGHDKDETIQVWQRGNEKFPGLKLVNVDTSTREGIARAKKLGLAQSGLADIVFAPLPSYALTMFDPDHKARFFALFRHPIERAVSMFYYRQVASWERDPNVYKPDLAKVDIEDWLKNRGGKADVSNFLMSSLLGKRYFSEKDLEKAKEILRSKVLVGLLSKMEESVQHFDTYFGWYENNEKRSKCQDSAIQKGVNRNPHESVEEGSEAWELLADLNYYDLQLYEYILELYEEQGRELFGEGVEQKVEESTTITSE